MKSKVYKNMYKCADVFHYKKISTLTEINVIVLEQDVDAVNIINPTKIHLPPHGFVRRAVSYLFRPHTRRCVSVNCVTSVVVRACICV